MDITQDISDRGNIIAKTVGHFKRNSWAYTACTLVLGVGGLLRAYLSVMGFSVGTDYYSEAFQTYWMPVLYAELIFLGGFTVVLSTYFWLTRIKDASTIPPEVELARWWRLLAAFVVMAVWGGGIAATAVESDAAWHQVTIRDTDFTPTHIYIFYFALPFLTAMLIPTFIWAHTRIPTFMNKVSLPFLFIVCGILMIMPNYGFNEWGHTFFYAEELFAAPIHWGFVFLGWSLFFLIPLAVQIFTTMARLISTTVEE